MFRKDIGEIIHVTGTRASDQLTGLVRAQGGTSARAIVPGDNVAVAAIDKLWTDIETATVLRSVWFGAGAFSARNGSPTKASRGTALLYDGWNLSHGSTMDIVGQIAVPKDAATATPVLVYPYWTNIGGNSGNVRMLMQTAQIVNNASQNLNTPGSPTNQTQTLAALAQDIQLSSAFASLTLLGNPDDLLEVLVQRIGGNILDTLTNDIAILGVRLDYTGRVFY